MFRLRTAKAHVCRGFSALRRPKPAVRQTITIRMAQVTSAVHHRQLAGLTTTLRQLHTVSQLNQPEALNILSELEREGILIINHNVADAFESTITLSDEAQQQLDLVVDANAAPAAA